MIINNLDLRIFDFVNVFLVSHFNHEPPARETGQPLPVYLTVNKLYLYLYLYLWDPWGSGDEIELLN